jgi:DNA polymerase-3 subunit beta
MELSLRTTVPAQVEGEGTIVVPGRVLSDLVRLLPGETLRLREVVEERVVEISSASGEYRLHTLAVEDFPRLPEVEGESAAALQAGPFLEALAAVLRAAGRDESRPVLTGVLLRTEEDRLVLAATDSYRLAVKEMALSRPATLDVIVPARALEEARRLASGLEAVEIGQAGHHVVVRCGSATLATRRIDGQFPDYRALAPKPEEYTLEARLPRLEVLEAVRRVAVMAQRAAPLRLQLGDGELRISVQAQDVGQGREVVPLAIRGEGLEIGFNADYLRDGLESATAEEVTLRLINPLRPGLIESPSERFWYLLMPIRLAA